MWRGAAVNLEELSDAHLEELLVAARENRRRAREIDAEHAIALGEKITEISARGDKPSIGVYAKHVARPAPVPPPPAVIESSARFLVTDRAGLPLRDALAGLADHLIEMGCDPANVESAFAAVLARKGQR